jgi:aspartyl-tRNA(Asn)/glutamyl-tRNA(Gln) amidotransferase subunit A
MTPLSRRDVLNLIATCSTAGGLTACRCQSPVPKGSSDDFLQLDIRNAADAIRARRISPVQLTQYYLERITRFDQKLNSFITVAADQALESARRAEQEAGRGEWRGPLHGIPIAVKDNIDCAGLPTTAASSVFATRIAKDDADVVHRLKAAGAVVLGKLNMHEFAQGTTSTVSFKGPVRNPWDTRRVAGGSSGGCGAAVAAGLCLGAVGTDTGGSVRIPASCCAIVGLKPTYGVVSVHGTIPVSAAFDHVGPMCRTVSDTALMFRAMTDHTTASAYDPGSSPSVSGFRVGVLPAGPPTCDVTVEPEVQAAFDSAIHVIRSFVADVRPVPALPMPSLDALINAEIYRYHVPYLSQARHGYDPRTLKDILAGKGISDREVNRLRNALQAHRALRPLSFSDVDLVVNPTLPVLPLEIEAASEPFALTACTFAFSLGGWPSLSLPCGFSRSGLPIGLLISGPPYAEPRILALAEAYERRTEWHRRRPLLA